MPIRTIPGGGGTYTLIAFDRDGVERPDDPDGRGGLLSSRLIEELAHVGVTDVFLYSHGWKGDIPAAIDQYDRWIKAVQSLDADQAQMAAKRAGFEARHVGLHWPSQPWGDEEFGGPGAAFDAAGGAAADLVDTYVRRLGDSPRIRAAVDIVVDEARRHAAADTMPPRAHDAYMDLNNALGLGAGGVGADPGQDRQTFDPGQAMADAQFVAPEYGFDAGGILGVLRQLSFWAMKKRGRIVGEGGLHNLLNAVQRAAPQAAVHLMGHSFGCVVMSSMLGGPGGKGTLVRPVESCVLVQGAMSLWAYSADIPVQKGTPGYCSPVLLEGRVRGPLVATRSTFDRAVGFFYPLAAGAAHQIEFAGLPSYGGIGAFGIQGVPGAADLRMLPASGVYPFRLGGVFNLEGSRYICRGGGASGAHSDIDGPEVAHVVWAAALAS